MKHFDWKIEAAYSKISFLREKIAYKRSVRNSYYLSLEDLLNIKDKHFVPNYIRAKEFYEGDNNFESHLDFYTSDRITVNTTEEVDNAFKNLVDVLIPFYKEELKKLEAELESLDAELKEVISMVPANLLL